MSNPIKNCLVIGGNGFIGRHVTSILCESGRDVTVLGRSSEASPGLHPGARYISGDYGNRSLLRSLLSPGCEVIDLAYSTVPKTSFEDPSYDLLSNLPVSVGLFQEALDAQIGRLVIVSSGGTVYGPTESLPILEDHPTLPVSPYGITKLTTDRYAFMFHRNSGLPVVIGRPSNAYGEGQRTGTGQGFIAAAIAAILSGREIEIFGEQGTIRDYIHVADVASGILNLLEYGVDGEVYNLGTGIGTSNEEIVQILERFAQRESLPVQRKILPSRKFDVHANVLESSKLRAACCWTPEVPLEQGLERVWNSALGNR